MNKDSVIILSWPKTPAKAIGMWYDSITKFFGFLKDGYYKAGHAASVIVNHSKKELHYYDFGRYHMPTKYGRVRSKETNPALALKCIPKFSNKNELINIEEILAELYANKNCKGKGVLYASIISNVSFEDANNYAISMQNKDAIPYGPYTIGGTNCSRFIASIAKASKPSFKIKFNLLSSLLLTPLPNTNVFACNSEYYTVNSNGIIKYKLKVKNKLRSFMLPLLN